MSHLPVGWKNKQLGDVLSLEYGKPLPREDRDDNGAYPVYGANGIKAQTNQFYCDRPSIIVGRKGSAGEVNLTEDKFWPLDVTYFVKFDERLYDQMFLYHCLTGLNLQSLAKGVKPGINRNDVYSIKCIFPPLPEQKRIVAILDEAFVGISQAVANAEKNLANARELFESYLNSMLTPKGEGWSNTTIGELCETVEYGSSLKSKSEGSHPVLRMGNIQNRSINWDDLVYTDDPKEIEKYLLKNNDVLFNRTNSEAHVGKTAIYKGEMPAIFAGYLIRIHRKKDLIDAEFLNYYLNSTPARKYGKTVMSRSVNQANINGTKLKQYPISIPSLKKQKKIVLGLRKLAMKTQHLETIYQQKLTALTELKQSILQKAFSGELIADSMTTSLKSVEVETTSLEFTANILAYAYYRHALQKRDKTFGHVKAQKLLHLVESIGGIDLGRNAIKDAAGPNDFQHMLRAEDWAKANQVFEFLPAEKGYAFKKLSRFNTISKAFSAIRPYRKKMEKIIDLLIPMNKEEAEVFATVHAAWNELVFKGDEFDDAKIIYEARDNWHSDKMNIPVSKFRKAILLIRDKKLIPDGKAKRIGGQERLF